jgi:hypothetical protein
MPKASRETATIITDVPPALDRSEDLDGYTASFVEIRLTHDLAPMLKSLPGGNCSCPHWGYMISGKIILRYGDGREEVFGTGDAFYMPPGHAPEAEAGSEFVLFSPTDELAATEAAIQAAMAGS